MTGPNANSPVSTHWLRLTRLSDTDDRGRNSSFCGRGSSVPVQLGAGSDHGKLDEALAGWLVHLPEPEDREPVE
jgi:hypothetical protein